MSGQKGRNIERGDGGQRPRRPKGRKTDGNENEGECRKVGGYAGQLAIFVGVLGVVQMRVTRETWSPLIGAALAR